MEDDLELEQTTLDEELEAYANQPEAAFKQGYADNSAHAYIKERHENILGSPVAEDSVLQTRQSLEAKYGTDAINVIAERAKDLAYASIKALEEEEEQRALEYAAAAGAMETYAAEAMGDPQTALAVADTEVLAPEAADPVKLAMAMYDRMRMTVASRVKDRPVISFGFNNKVMDLLGGIVPFRDYAGQLKAASNLGEEGFLDAVTLQGYYDTLKEWQTLDSYQQFARWDELEETIWKAAGNNEFIYLSMIDPFIDPSDVIWTKIGAGVAAVDLASILLAAPRLVKSFGSAIRGAKYYNKAKMLGNDKAAGQAALAALKKGNLDTIVEAWPVSVPDPLGNAPWAVPEMAKPVYMSMLDEFIERGIITGPDDMIIPLKGLTDAERVKVLDYYKSAVAKNGVILKSAELGDGVIELTVERTVKETVDFGTLLSKQRALRNEVRKGQRALKKEVSDAGVGVNEEQKKLLTEQLQKAKDELHDVNWMLKEMRKEGAKEIDILSPLEEKITHTITVDDIGRLETFDNPQRIGMIAHALGSQEVRAGSVFPGMTSEGTMVRQQQLRLFGMFDRAIKEVYKSLKGKVRSLSLQSERDRVSKLLLTGDRQQRVYSTSDLVNGIDVDGLGRTSFNEREIAAYRRLREIQDNLWYVMNKTQIDELEFGGFKEFRVKYPKKDGTFEWVPVHARAEDLAGDPKTIGFSVPTVGKNHITRVIDAATGDIVDVSSIPGLGGALNKRTKGFVELKDDFIVDGKHHRWMLVDVDEVGDLRQVRQARKPGFYGDPLDYRKGYVAKITNEPIQFIVSRPMPIIINGIEESTKTAVRGFVTSGEANAYLATLKPDSGAVVDSLRGLYKEVPTSKEAKRLVDFVDKQLFSGSFTGYRHASAEFKIGLDGHEAERISAWDSMRRYADFAGNYVPAHKYKQAVIARFMRDLKNPTTGQTELRIPTDWTSEITLHPTHKNYRYLKSQQDWMKQTFAIPTSEEDAWERMWGLLRASIDHKAWGLARNMPFAQKILLSAHKKLLTAKFTRDPVQMFKSAVFDTMLGMFSPTQYFVQSAGMLIPMSLHPVEAVAALPKFMFLRYAFRLPNLDAVETAARAVGLNGKEMRELTRALHRSGIPEAVLETGDFGHYFGTHAGWHSAGMIQDIRDKGRMFYKMGELNNRIFAYTMAAERLAAKKGWDLTKAIDNDKVQAIVAEALRIGINFTAANKARWQDGLLGLPTQFLQVSAKTAENMVYGLFNFKGGLVKENQWTQAEALTAVFFNTIMHGAAGWGIDEIWKQFNAWLTDEKEGLGLDPTNPKHREWISFYRGGLMELLTLKTFGTEIDISDRVSPIGGLAQVWENQIEPLFKMMVEGEAAELGQVLLGATSSFGTKLHKGAAETLRILGAAADQEEWNSDTMLAVAHEFGKLTSGYSSWFKAWAMFNLQDMPKGATWQAMGFYDEVPNSLVLAQAMGFPPLDVEKFYDIRNNAQARKKDINDIAKLLYDYRKQAVSVTESGMTYDPAGIRMANLIQHTLLNRLDPENRSKIYMRMMELGEEDQDGNLYTELFREIVLSTPESEAEKEARGDLMMLQSIGIQRGDTDAD